MKVEVLTVDEVKISKFRWWSNWVDIAVFDYGYCGHLLQMKISRRNAKRFKCVAYQNLGGAIHADVGQAGDLTQTNKLVT